MAVSASNAALQPALWRKVLWADVRDNLFFGAFASYIALHIPAKARNL